MSAWHDIEKEGIDCDPENKEVRLYVTQDYFGSIYAILTFDQIKEIYEQIIEGER